MAEWTGWTFMDYCSAGGNNPISEWYESVLSVQQRADVDALLRVLRNSRIWNVTDFRARIQGREGLSEIRLKSERTQIRLIGRQAPGFRYVLLIGCTHKQQIYDPKSCLDTAERRKKEIDRGEASTREHEI